MKCPHCHKPVRTGNNVSVAARRARLIAAGKCGHCGKRTLETSDKCVVCRDKRNDRRRALYAEKTT